MFEWVGGRRRSPTTTIFLALTTILGVRGAHAESMQFVVNGQARTVLVERPAEKTPRPTIILLHEAGGTAAGIAHGSSLAQLAPRQGLVGIFPQGLAGSRWNFYPPGKETAGFIQMSKQVGGVPDDVAFLKTVVADFVRRGVSDPKRIYLAGNSNGGFMALRMICVDAGMFTSIGLLIAGMPEVTGADCRPARAMPVLMIKGTADQIVPHGGGFVANVLPVWPTERLVAFFHRLNGCDGPLLQSLWSGQHPEKIEIVRPTSCSGGPVVLYRVVGGGHQVPGALNASQILLNFFSDKAR